jgi:acyl dehydratase
MSSRRFEDFAVGQRLTSGSYLVTPEAIFQFAREFDPQVFHLDATKAKGTIFGGVAASGWHTAAISMRLFVNTMNVAGGIVGLGVDELRWPNAVRPGDELRVDIEIVDARRSKSRPGQGILRVQNVTKNQHDQIVQSFTATAMVARSAS